MALHFAAQLGRDSLIEQLVSTPCIYIYIMYVYIYKYIPYTQEGTT